MHLSWRFWLLRFTLVLVLVVAFLAYLRPSFILDLAVRVIACF